MNEFFNDYGLFVVLAMIGLAAMILRMRDRNTRGKEWRAFAQRHNYKFFSRPTSKSEALIRSFRCLPMELPGAYRNVLIGKHSGTAFRLLDYRHDFEEEGPDWWQSVAIVRLEKELDVPVLIIGGSDYHYKAKRFGRNWNEQRNSKNELPANCKLLAPGQTRVALDLSTTMLQELGESEGFFLELRKRHATYYRPNHLVYPGVSKDRLLERTILLANAIRITES